MRWLATFCACAVLVLLSVPAVVGQAVGEADVRVDFLRSDVVLMPEKDVEVRLQVTASLSCLPGMAPPDAAIRLWATHGAGSTGPAGEHHRSEVDPAEIWFVPSGPGRFVINETVTVRFWSEVAPLAASTHEVVYATETHVSSTSCTPTGWSAASAAPDTLHLHVVPADDEAAQESPTAPLLLILVACLACVGVRRGDRA